MTSDNKIENIEKSMTWMLLGLIGVYVFVNAIGFIGPFWAGLRNENADEQLGHSRDLLVIAQKFNRWFSLLFIISAWHLANIHETRYGRWVIVAFGACVSGSYFCERMFYESSPDSPVLIIFSGFQFFSLIVYIALIRKCLRTLRST